MISFEASTNHALRKINIRLLLLAIFSTSLLMISLRRLKAVDIVFFSSLQSTELILDDTRNTRNDTGLHTWQEALYSGLSTMLRLKRQGHTSSFVNPQSTNAFAENSKSWRIKRRLKYSQTKSSKISTLLPVKTLKIHNTSTYLFQV